MADLLSSASLALAALALFLNLWLPQIEGAASIKVPIALKAADAKPLLDKMRPVARGKALPLSIASFATFLALGQPAVTVLWRSAKNVHASGGNSVSDYDAVQALFLIVWVLTGLLAFAVLKQTIRLMCQIKAMKERNDEV